MASHSLGLNIQDTSNESILVIDDISVYTDLLDVVCPQLLITAPGFKESAVISGTTLEEGFRLRLTACDLRLQYVKCDSEMNALPDGVYAIRYQVSPHEYVFVEYNHMRITSAINLLASVYCNLDLSDCFPEESKQKKLDQLTLIEQYLKSAKYKVEECHEAEKGKKLYDYAIKMIDKLDCTFC